MEHERDFAAAMQHVSDFRFALALLALVVIGYAFHRFLKFKNRDDTRTDEEIDRKMREW